MFACCKRWIRDRRIASQGRRKRRGVKRWALLLGIGLCVGCGRGGSEADVPILPERSWRGTALPMPVSVPSTFSQTPRPYKTYAFTTTGGIAALFTRDPWQILFFPQLGRRVFSLSDPYDYVLMFDDGRDVFAYDISAEEKVHLVEGRLVGGFAFKSTLGGADHLYFLATSDPALAARRLGFVHVMAAAPRASPSAQPAKPRDFYLLRPFQGVPAGLMRLNAFAAEHGAVQSFRAAKTGDLFALTTGDGSLCAYEAATDQLYLVLPSLARAESGGARDVRIQPVFARYLLWLDLRAERLFLFDRWNGTLEPVVIEASLGRRAILSDAKFLDAYRLGVIATFPEDPPFQRFVTYDLVRRTFEAVAVLNLAREAL